VRFFLPPIAPSPDLTDHNDYKEEGKQMGARINFVFKTSEFALGEPQTYVVLYSHWGADSWREDLAMALDKARPRWNDFTYGTRIVISQLTKEAIDSETGFGIFSTNTLDHFFDEWVLIDFPAQEVDGKSFGAFTDYHLEVMEYNDFSKI
jgi:hypothetical protein